jgi:hypothetical protein
MFSRSNIFRLINRSEHPLLLLIMMRDDCLWSNHDQVSLRKFLFLRFISKIPKLRVKFKSLNTPLFTTTLNLLNTARK